MTAFIYILESSDSKRYIGSTNDLKRRLTQHKRGHTKSTSKLRNLKLVFSQKYNTLSQAHLIEKRIKSWKRRDFIDKIIKEGYIKITQ